MLLLSQNQARDFLHLLGLMASWLELIPNGQLFMRPIQLHLLAWSHVGKDFIQGTWTRSLLGLHINLLELEAVFLTVKHFLPVIKNKNVLIRSCQYVNRQGGTKYPPLCYSIWVLRNFVLENNMHLKAAHILGSLNIFTDQLSRQRVWPKEW